MKRPGARVILAGAIMAFAGSGSAQPGATPSETTEGVRTIERVLDAFHDAAAKADFDRYFAQQTADAVFLGTDASERWQGKQFREFCRPYFEQGRGWTYRPRARRVALGPGERTAWFDELLDNDSYGECRGSGVLVRTDSGDWKIAQYNLSIPIPNDLAKEFVARIRAHKP